MSPRLADGADARPYPGRHPDARLDVCVTIHAAVPSKAPGMPGIVARPRHPRDRDAVLAALHPGGLPGALVWKGQPLAGDTAVGQTTAAMLHDPRHEHATEQRPQSAGTLNDRGR